MKIKEEYRLNMETYKNKAEICKKAIDNIKDSQLKQILNDNLHRFHDAYINYKIIYDDLNKCKYQFSEPIQVVINESHVLIPEQQKMIEHYSKLFYERNKFFYEDEFKYSYELLKVPKKGLTKKEIRDIVDDSKIYGINEWIFVSPILYFIDLLSSDYNNNINYFWNEKRNKIEVSQTGWQLISFTNK